MDRRLAIHHGTWRLLLAGIVALALVLTLDAGSVTAASKGCSVKDKATGLTHSTLQAAVNAARPRATLLVRGTCGGKTVIGKSLRIRGVPGGRWGVPRLTAIGTPVLAIQHGVKVTAASLLIAGGKGVINRGNTTLIDVRVKGASYAFPPPKAKGARRGILNSGTLRLLGRSWVRRTSGVVNTGLLTLGGTTHIRSNVVSACDRSSVRNTGTLEMNGRSDIGRNRCDGESRSWGAPLLNVGRLVMNDRSTISYQEGGNTSPASSGVWNLGTMVMNDRSSVLHNRAGAFWSFVDGTGGGVYNAGRLIMRGHSVIHDNLAEHEAEGGRGGGVFNSGTLVMQGSAVIRDNVASAGRGGGVFNAKDGTIVGVICGPGGNAYGNTPDDCYFAE